MGLSCPPEPLDDEACRSFIRRFDGMVVSSDAFFPFRDSIDRAVRINVRALAHPGGSMRDEVVRAAADGYGVPLIATGLRCFTH